MTDVTQKRPVTEVIGIVVVLGVFFLLKLPSLGTIHAGDHGIYLYASEFFSQGIIPYKHFFFAHPPIQLIPSILLTLIFGPHLMLFNVLPVLASLISGVLIFLIVREASDRLIALTACVLFLFSYSNLSTSIYYTGQNLALMLMLTGVLLFVQKRECKAGLFFGIAFCTAVNALVGFVAAASVLALINRKRLIGLVGGFVASAGVIHLITWLVSGDAFIEQVYLFHLNKLPTVRVASRTEVFSFLAEAHVALLLFTLIAVCIFAYYLYNFTDEVRNAPSRRLILLSFTFFVLYSLFLLRVIPLFPHYALFLVPFCTILAASTLVSIFQKGKCIVQTNRYDWRALLGGIVLIGMVGMTVHDTRNTYDTELRYSSFNHAEEVSAYLRENLEPHQTIYGGFGVTPTVSLLSGHNIAGHEIDSSVMRFQSGLYKVEDVIEAIEEDDVGAIISREMRGIAYFAPFQKYLQKTYYKAQTFREKGSGTVAEVWLRKL